jgi:hypothetical protein
VYGGVQERHLIRNALALRMRPFKDNAELVN